jgi:HAD superfamily hydrolase (TIGR01509 family)
MRAGFQAVFFDFAGTLFSYRSEGFRSLNLIQRAAERLGRPGEPRTLGETHRSALHAAYGVFSSRPFYLHRDLFRDTFRRFAEALGAPATAEDLDWYQEEQRRLVLERFELRSDCLRTLGALRDRGLHLAVVSNIDDDYLDPMIRRCELSDVLHAWTSSEEAASCKPDAGIFHHALHKAGAVPAQVLFVGDSPEHDVAGARPLGMTTALIREPDAETPGGGFGDAPEAHHVIASLSELVPIIDRQVG